MKLKIPEKTQRESWRLVIELDRFLDKPLIFLSFVWIALIIIDLTRGLTPFLSRMVNVIWAFFIFDFVLGFVIAPKKLRYIKRNWITAISMLLPAFGILRLFRAFRTLRLLRMIRSFNLVRLFASLRRGIKTLRRLFKVFGFGYVVLLTVLVLFVGAAGAAYFESPSALEAAGIGDVGGIDNYGEALWWTAMMLTTMGSDYWPKTWEGRFLSWLLALYAFTFFSYITANIATHFVTSGEKIKEKKVEHNVNNE